MDTVRNHKDLAVWQKSIGLARAVYAATKTLPSEERLELSRQLRRAAVSIASNVAEGCAKRRTVELLQSLHLARGSLSELETKVMIAADQGLSATDVLTAQIAEVARLLNNLIRSVATAKQAAHARACISYR